MGKVESWIAVDHVDARRTEQLADSVFSFSPLRRAGFSMTLTLHAAFMRRNADCKIAGSEKMNILIRSDFRNG